MSYLLTIVASMIGTILQRISGTGVALVAAPFLAAFFGPVEGILITNLINSAASFILCFSVLNEVDWRRCFGLALFAFVGEAVGSIIVKEVSAEWMQLIIGATVVLAMLTTWLSGKRLPYCRSPLALPLTGFGGGILMATAGLGAPATVIYASFIRWPQSSFAATMQPLFGLMAGGAFVIKRLSGVPFEPVWASPLHIGGIVLALVAAVVVGSRLAYRIAPQTARNLAFLLAGGGALLAAMKGLIGLMM